MKSVFLLCSSFVFEATGRTKRALGSDTGKLDQVTPPPPGDHPFVASLLNIIRDLSMRGNKACRL